MRRNDWMIRTLAVAALALAVAGCGPMRHLRKEGPRADVQLPARAASALKAPEPEKHEAPKVITFKKADGTELHLAPVDRDSVTGEEIMSLAIDEVVIAAPTRRNVAERNGKIGIEFMVIVPEALHHRDWRLVLAPQLRKGPDSMSLAPLVYSGDRYREMQRRDYAAYERYRSRITDSTDYFYRFGRQGAYDRRMRWFAEQHEHHASDFERLAALTPAEAETDPQVGWTTDSRLKGRYDALRRYVRRTDRQAARRVAYTSDAGGEYGYLNDYFTPRYRYEGVEALPGGAIYTRVDGVYPDETDRRREDYFRSLAERPGEVAREVDKADKAGLEQLAAARAAYTGRSRAWVAEELRAMGDSARTAIYDGKRAYARRMADIFGGVDSLEVQRQLLRSGAVARNETLIADSGRIFARRVRHPYLSDPRLDTVIRRLDGSLEYHYVEEVQADENTSKIHLYLTGRVESRSGQRYDLARSDTLTYNVASMTTFLDETPRYVQRIVTRDAEANARFYFTFPVGRSVLVDTLEENRRQVEAVRELTYGLMTDPVYLIDSITLRATSSPEGRWEVNDRLARERAEALKQVLATSFRTLYDSLRISASVTLDDQGREVLVQGSEDLPDLPNRLRTSHLAEDWEALRGMIAADAAMPDREGILAAIEETDDPDRREWHIRTTYPKGYDYMRRRFYPEMRAVDFRFNLHRRGMKQDTVYTTEIDSAYMHAVDLLKKRRYDEALTILRPYEDRNTALAYMSAGYDAAAYRILRGLPGTDASPDLQYMQAILAARLGDEEQAVRYFLRSVELRPGLKFRGNLDPEISRLIRKYGLFEEDFR